LTQPAVLTVNHETNMTKYTKNVSTKEREEKMQ